MANRAALLALQRYFSWADRMHQHFEEREACYLDERLMHWEPYLAYWSGGLYAVIEGWRELRLTDPRIDDLLTSPHVELLRRYRNGAFHFQQDYFDKRFVSFWEDDSVLTARGSARDWSSRLHSEYARWFREELPKLEGWS